MEKIKCDRSIDYSDTDVDINYLEGTVNEEEINEDTIEFTDDFLSDVNREAANE